MIFENDISVVIIWPILLLSQCKLNIYFFIVFWYFDSTPIKPQTIKEISFSKAENATLILPICVENSSGSSIISLSLFFDRYRYRYSSATGATNESDKETRYVRAKTVSGFQVVNSKQANLAIKEK